jgi:predicted amidophosphoribosyltransferase
MTQKEKYWLRREAGLCIRCGKPTQKSRCPECMTDLAVASRKSRLGRIERLKRRIAELEAMNA